MVHIRVRRFADKMRLKKDFGSKDPFAPGRLEVAAKAGEGANE
jgi:hypothetical protein